MGQLDTATVQLALNLKPGDDGLVVETMVSAAKELADNFCKRSLFKVKEGQTHSFYADSSSCVVRLPVDDVLEIDSVTSDGTDVGFTFLGDRVKLNDLKIDKEVVITYSHGQAKAPADVCQAALAYVGVLYEDHRRMPQSARQVVTEDVSVIQTQYRQDTSIYNPLTRYKAVLRRYRIPTV